MPQKPSYEEIQQKVKELKDRIAVYEKSLCNFSDYQEIVENQPELICRWLPDTTLTFVNHAYAQFFDQSPQELLGTQWIDLLPETEKRQLLSRFQAISPEQPVLTKEHYVQRSDGEWRWLVWTNKAFFDAQGNMTHILGVGRDETEKRQAEEQFRATFERAGIGMSIVDLVGRIRRSNAALQEMLGYSADELTNMEFADFTDSEAVHADRELSQELFLGKRDFYQIEKRLFRKNGQVLLGCLTASLVRNVKGEPLFAIYMIEDLTERKRAKQILEDRLRLMQFSMSHSLEELLIATLDEAEALTDSQVGFYHFLEPDQKTLSLQAWSSHTINEMCQAEEKDMSYDLAKAGVWVDCIHKGEGVIHNDYAALSHKKGLPPGHAPILRELVVPVFRDSRIVAVLGVGNKPRDYTSADLETVSLLGDMVWDIVERKQAEEDLNHTKTLLENVYASLDEAVFVISPKDRRIISCNNAAENMFGYHKEEMIGNNTKFLHANPIKYYQFGKKLFPVLDSNGIFHAEYNMRNKDGTTFPTEHTVKEVRSESGERTMVVSVVRDITYQKNAMKDLEDKEKNLREKTERLNELNNALQILLEQRDQEKKHLEESFSESINGQIIPYLERIKKSDLNDFQKEAIDILEANLKEIIKPYLHRISDKLLHLTPSETRIVNHLKQGYRTKEIASILNISPRTVEYHRDNIRKKLGIKNRKTNLHTYLSNII